MGTRLRPVPEHPERVLGLIRVSKERDGMVSPEVQRAAIGDYCTARGYQVDGWAEGLDESGSRAKSAWWPRLEQAVAEVESGKYDLIVVWKYSRVSRNRLRWATAVDRVEAAGGRIESATEQVDTSTSTGRFTRGMLAELQAFEAERIGEVWKEIHERRVRSGKPASGKPKYGYAYNPALKLHVPDPVTGPVLTDLYRRYVAGESFYSLVRWLNGHGHPTTSGGLWGDVALRRVMDAGFATGRFMSRGELIDGVHEPLIEERLWLAYLDSRGRRRAAPSRRERSTYLLSGLVRCARCRGPMVGGQYGSDRQPKYRCKTSQAMGPGACRGGYVMARFIEAAVVSWLEDLATDVDTARAAKVAASAQRTVARSERTRLAREVSRAEDALGRLALQHAQTPLPQSVYRSTYDELLAQLDRLNAALEDAGQVERRVVVSPRAAARQLLVDWHETPVALRREGLGRLVKHVLVTTGRPRATFVIVEAWD
jgi:site-specific DNA recombinase